MFEGVNIVYWFWKDENLVDKIAWQSCNASNMVLEIAQQLSS